MSIPSKLDVLIQRLVDELDQIEEAAIEGINLARLLLERFPNNFAFI